MSNYQNGISCNITLGQETFLSAKGMQMIIVRGIQWSYTILYCTTQKLTAWKMMRQSSEGVAVARGWR